MAIKRIQLRGISRTPSDRTTNDGGCAESLNVQLDNTEIAPLFMPEDVTMKMGLPEGIPEGKIFIHQLQSRQNIILYDSKNEKLSAFIDDTVIDLAHFSAKEDLVISSVGNTLIVSHSQQTQYFLFRNREYKHLGSRVPFPVIQFTPKYYTEKTYSARETQSFSIEENSSTGTDANKWLSQGEYTKKTWNDKNLETENDPDNNPGTQAVNRACIDLAKQLYTQADEDAVFIDQVFVRYAVKLYDDTTLSSVPYLMPGGFENPFLLRYRKSSYYWFKTISKDYPLAGVEEVYKHTNYEEVLCKAKYPYRIEAKMLTSLDEFEEWKDLIKSIDIYISEKKTPNFNGIHATTCEEEGTGEYMPDYSFALSSLGENSAGIEHFEGLQITKTNLLLSIGGPMYTSNFESRLVDRRQFYRVEHLSYNTEEGSYSEFKKRIDELRAGTMVDTSAYFGDYDALVSDGEILTNDDMTHAEYLFGHADSFNNSLIVSGITELLGTGSAVIPFPSVEVAAMEEIAPNVSIENTFSSLTPYWVPDDYSITGWLRFHFIVEDDDGTFVIEAKDYSGSNIFQDSTMAFYGWMAFPYKNCTKVIVDDGNGYGMTFTMKPHPHLNCSYFYSSLKDNIVAVLDHYGDKLDIPAESRMASRGNKVFQTNMDNPFSFPLNKRFSFNSRVLGTAIATTYLSQGQFGQFPLYVFTEEGVWVMETASDGSFVTSKPLSRVVCVNPDSITPLDNAIVFVSPQGVMLLQGSQVVNISPFMNGRHYAIESTAQTIIEKQDFFCDLLPVLSDTTHFFAFVKKATVAYDCAGQRLIFIKKGERYQYIYKIDTQTWHKVAYDMDIIAPINSYPKCLVQASGQNIVIRKTTVLLNVSTETEDTLIDFIQSYLPNVSAQEISSFLAGKGHYINTVDLSDEDLELLDRGLYDMGVQISIGNKEDIVASRIYDLSSTLDAMESRTPTKGVIATRPFDLDEPDVFKTITDVRVRGQYAKGAVKFILLGSNDGINFRVISTLRGKSWKLFRIIILADLDPTERISWIDVQYETKFTNRLR